MHAFGMLLNPEEKAAYDAALAAKEQAQQPGADNKDNKSNSRSASPLSGRMAAGQEEVTPSSRDSSRPSTPSAYEYNDEVSAPPPAYTDKPSIKAEIKHDLKVLDQILRESARVDEKNVGRQ